MTDMWRPGFLYSPGDVVQPRLTDPVTQDALTNSDFEAGDTGWGTGGNWSITSGNAFAGTFKAKFATGLLMAIADGDDNDNFATSSDGITWTPDDIEVGVEFLAAGTQLAHSSTLGRFLFCELIGSFGRYSDDNGATWVAITPTGDVPVGGCRALEYVPELNSFFFHATNEEVFRSSDGIAWTKSSATLTGAGTGFAYSASLGRLVVGISTGTTIYTSDDGGATFTARTIGGGVGDVKWSPELSLFVAASTGRDVFTSSDGITWSTTTDALPVGMIGSRHSLSYSPTQERFVNIDNGSPYAAFSDSGTSWTSAATPVALAWSSVIWDALNNQFIAAEAGGASSSFMTSPTGNVWTERTTTTAGIGGWATLISGASPVTPIDSMENTARLPVVPGQLLSADAFAKITGNYTANIAITWHGVADALLQTDFGDSPIAGSSTAYRRVTATFEAPQGALTASVAIGVLGSGTEVFFDNVTISHTNPVTISLFLFKAVQALSGFSDADEPVWPTVLGNTVVDNQVTWEAIDVNRVVWRATPILISGASEPTFPATIDGEVADNTISWKALSRRVEDENCPNTAEVAIVASKIFAADKDIIPFSATVNPLDWTTANDAGFIPFGLNSYGSQDVSGLGLYRSNLVAFNSKGFQMWQVDADPANFAILDAVPIGIPEDSHQSIQPVSNDLVFLTEAGIRSMGIAGASTNLQAGHFGKQIDDLVLPAFAAATNDPLALFYPGQGQYWLIFDDEAFVLTMNGGKQDMSWSRYTFPADIDDWTILNKDLYLRAGDEVWRVSPDATLDQETAPNTGTDFLGEVWWPYLDFGGLGDQKMMHGFDLVGSGACTVTFGFDQSNLSLVTADWVVTDIDTLPGTMIPMPISGPSFQMRLSFSADNAWEWQAAAIYLDNQRTTS